MKIAVCFENKAEREDIVRELECYYHEHSAPTKIQEFDKGETLLEEAARSGFDKVFVCLKGAAGGEAVRQVKKFCKSCALIIINDTADDDIKDVAQ